MQVLFITLLTLLSIAIGFFLGVMVLSIDSPLKEVLTFGSRESDGEEAPPPQSKKEKGVDKQEGLSPQLSADKEGKEEDATLQAETDMEADEEEEDLVAEEMESPSSRPDTVLETEEEEDLSSQPGEDNETGELDKPGANAQLLLQIWRSGDDTLLYGFQGKYVTKQELPEDLIALLKPSEKEPHTQPEPPTVESQEEPEPEVVSSEEVEEAEVKPLSLINEIDEILQEKLSKSHLSEKGIKLTENHKKEITIWVGLKSYASIEEVPDPEIQNLIKESVKDWEDRKE